MPAAMSEISNGCIHASMHCTCLCVSFLEKGRSEHLRIGDLPFVRVRALGRSGAVRLRIRDCALPLSARHVHPA